MPLAPRYPTPGCFFLGRERVREYYSRKKCVVAPSSSLRLCNFFFKYYELFFVFFDTKSVCLRNAPRYGCQNIFLSNSSVLQAQVNRVKERCVCVCCS